VMASVVVVLFRPPDFTTNARHHKCLIFSKCSVSPTDFAEEANKNVVVVHMEKGLRVPRGGIVIMAPRCRETVIHSLPCTLELSIESP